MLSKFKTFAALCGAFFVAVVIAFLKGRKAGVQHIEAEQQRKRDALQQEYDEIDAGPVDPTGSYDRLRGLSNDKGRR
jgi:hypothetical protein